MRRRSYRSQMPVRPHRKPIALAIAARRPVISLRLVALLALGLLLALVLPRLAGADSVFSDVPQVEVGEGVARVHLETATDAQVLVEWGMAPNVSKVVRSSGTVHDLPLSGLEPGRLYVYRVVVDGQVVTPPTPFRTEGQVPVVSASLSM